MITDLTLQYWLRTFDEWAESRLSSPQYDEAHSVLVQCGLKRTKEEIYYSLPNSVLGARGCDPRRMESQDDE